MRQEWVENILDACRTEKIDFFFKQWGGVHKSTAGRMLHGKTYDEMPPRVAAPMPDRRKRMAMAQIHKAKAAAWNPLIAIKSATPQSHNRPVDSLASA